MKAVAISLSVIVFGLALYGNQWHDEADRYWNEAQKLKRKHEYKQAIEYLKRAVTAERKNEDPRVDELIAQLDEIAHLYQVIGKIDTALHYYKLSLAVSRKYEREENEAAALNSIGETYFSLGRYEEALESHVKALAVAEKNGFKDRVMLSLANIATAYRAHKNFNMALDYYKRAEKKALEIGSAINRAAIISNIGTLYFYNNDIEQAIEHYSRALSIDLEFKNNESLSVDLSNMGIVYSAQGRYGEALNNFEQALKIDESSRNMVRVAGHLNRIGDVYFNLGYNDRAIEFYHRSLEINSGLNNEVNAALLHEGLGRVYDSMGRYDDAVEQYMKALSLNKHMELNDNVLNRLGDIGMVYESRDRYDEAVDYLTRAIKIDTKADRRSKIAYNLTNIGKVMISAKRYDLAIDYLRQASDIHRETGQYIFEAEDLKNSGIAFYYKKEYTRAVEYLLKAYASLDGVKVQTERLFHEAVNDIYRWLVAAYVTTGNIEAAYETKERFNLEKSYYARNTDEHYKGISVPGGGKLKKDVPKNVAVVIFANMEWDDPRVIVISSDASAGYILDKAALVKAVYNERGSEIERFMSQKKGDIIFNTRPGSRRDHYYAEFEKIMNYYRFLLGKKYISKDEYETLNFLGKQLYEFLFRDVERDMAQKSAIIIQPEGALTTVPVESFVMRDGRFMVEKYDIQYAISQTLKDRVDKRNNTAGRRSIALMKEIIPPHPPAGKKIESARHFDHILAVAEKKLRAEEDIREVYGYFGTDNFCTASSGVSEMKVLGAFEKNSDIYTGEGVSEAAIKRLSGSGLLAQYRIIHFSGCGIIIPEAPLLSALVVSSGTTDRRDNGLLDTRELGALKIDADLVHIDELKMNPAGFSRGEGIWNLCGPLIDSGARGISVALWDVDNKARLFFISRVYELILQKNMPAGKAISEVKRGFIRGSFNTGDGTATEGPEDYSNPYFWGSCIYYGK
ncbi:MAG: tetratricopeptide repeat protein [Spirochaetes bacterium]|nr:tetratricopeptide repeat protein [Spirochaetota bacterium]